MLKVSPPGPLLVKCTKHDDAAAAVVAARVQVDESKVPVPCVPGARDHVTVSVGLVAPIVLVSVTVVVQSEGWPTTTVWQTTDVEVEFLGLGVTEMSKKPELATCERSPGKPAVILSVPTTAGV